MDATLARRSHLAGELGFEPRQTESESVVLPLHHSPRIYKRIQYVIRFCLAIACDGIRQIPAECGAVLLARSRPWQAAAMPLSEKRLHAISAATSSARRMKLLAQSNLN